MLAAKQDWVGLFGGPASLLRQELPEHVLQDSAVLVVKHFLRRINAYRDAEVKNRPVRAPGPNRDLAPLGKPTANGFGQSLKIVDFLAGQAERFRTLASPELQGQHAHAHEVAAMNPLISLSDHRPPSQHPRT